MRSVQQFRQEENAEAVFQQQTLENQKADNSTEASSTETARETGNKADSEGAFFCVCFCRKQLRPRNESSTEAISSAGTTENLAGNSTETRGRSESRRESETDNDMADTDSAGGGVTEGSSSAEDDRETNADIFYTGGTR